MIGFGPPTGVGVYSRDESVDWLAQWSFVAVNASRADAREKARALIARGRTVFYYMGAESWTPALWHPSLVIISSMTRDTPGVRGFIVNPEAGWAATSNEDAAVFGRALALEAKATSVGLVSTPWWPKLDAVARVTRGKIWASPEIYGNSSMNPATHREWFERYVSLWGAGMVIPSVAGWTGANRQFTGTDGAGSHAAYLRALPRAQGAIAWLVQGQESESLMANLRAWNPAGSILAQGALVARGLLSSWAGKIAIVAAVVLALGAVAWWRYT